MRRGMGLKTKDGQQPMPDIDGEQEWQLMMRLAKKQAVQGMIERGIQLMPEEQRPPRGIYMKALVMGEKIATLNKKVDAACVKVAAMMDEAGMPCCILKGQGTALTYPDPTARVPGDIDVWVMAPPKQVIGFARKALPDAPFIPRLACSRPGHWRSARCPAAALWLLGHQYLRRRRSPAQGGGQHRDHRRLGEKRCREPGRSAAAGSRRS